MKKSEYEASLAGERAYQERIGRIVGVPFALIAMPSWVGGFVLLPVLGPTALLIAAPGFIALGLSVLGHSVLTRRSEARESELLRRFNYGRSDELTDG